MSDFAFIDNMPDARGEHKARVRQYFEDTRREYLRLNIGLLNDKQEEVLERCSDMARAGCDVGQELNELETAANGLLLAVLLLKRQVGASR